MSEISKISNAEINQLLTWDLIVPVVRQALLALSDSSNEAKTDQNVLSCVESQRTFTPVPSGEGFLLCMPSYIQGLDLGYGKKESALACKLLSVFEGNARREPPLPSIDGSVMLYDGKTGVMKAMIDADQLTLWRTAAVTCNASKILWSSRITRSNLVLALVGAGNQGRAHGLAFHNQFKFAEIRVWNRTTSKARALVDELKKLGANANICTSTIECVQGADVIVTTTFSSTPLILDDWVKSDALINAVGVIRGGSELSPEIYKRANVYVETKNGAKNELPHLKIEGDLGEVALGKIPSPASDKITIFQSLGNGVEDAAVGLLLHELKKRKTVQ